MRYLHTYVRPSAVPTSANPNASGVMSARRANCRRVAAAPVMTLGFFFYTLPVSLIARALGSASQRHAQLLASGRGDRSGGAGSAPARSSTVLLLHWLLVGASWVFS